MILRFNHVVYCFIIILPHSVSSILTLIFTNNLPSELPSLQPPWRVWPAGCAWVSALPQSADTGIQTAHRRASGLAGGSSHPSPFLCHGQNKHHRVPGAIWPQVHVDSWHGESEWHNFFVCLIRRRLLLNDPSCFLDDPISQGTWLFICWLLFQLFILNFLKFLKVNSGCLTFYLIGRRYLLNHPLCLHDNPASQGTELSWTLFDYLPIYLFFYLLFQSFIFSFF